MKLLPLTKRKKLLHQLEQAIQRQADLLAELAGSYRHHDMVVPPEVGEALGVVTHRRRVLDQLRRLLESSTSGIGVRERIESLMEEMHKDEDVLQRVCTHP